MVWGTADAPRRVSSDKKKKALLASLTLSLVRACLRASECLGDGGGLV